MLENWFKKVNLSISNLQDTVSSDRIGSKVQLHTEEVPLLQDKNVIIFSDNDEISVSIKSHFYRMYHHFSSIKIVDLGILRSVESNFLLGLFSELILSNTFCIILSNNPTVQQAYIKALDQHDSSYRLMSISNQTQKISVDQLNNCEEIFEMGFQSHLSSFSSLHPKTKLLRLGSIKNDLSEAEPNCRRQDAVFIDLAAIKASEIPDHARSGPAGLSSEEISQIFRYLGFNDKLKAIIFNDIDSQIKQTGQTSALIAQCIWYYCEALDHCVTENIHNNEDHVEYLVEITGLDEPINFLKAKRSGRWWIKDVQSNELIPCNHQDYLTACRNEIPERILES